MLALVLLSCKRELPSSIAIIDAEEMPPKGIHMAGFATRIHIFPIRRVAGVGFICCKNIVLTYYLQIMLCAFSKHSHP